MKRFAVFLSVDWNRSLKLDRTVIEGMMHSKTTIIQITTITFLFWSKTFTKIIRSGEYQPDVKEKVNRSEVQ